jgi:hypothetical protein
MKYHGQLLIALFAFSICIPPALASDAAVTLSVPGMV